MEEKYLKYKTKYLAIRKELNTNANNDLEGGRPPDITFEEYLQKLKLVIKDGMQLQHLDVQFKKDISLVLKAVEQNEKAFKYADTKLKDDLLVLLTAKQIEIQDSNKNIALKHVKMNGLALQFYPTFKEDAEVVKAALTQNIGSFRYVDSTLINQKFAKELIQINKSIYAFLSNDLKIDQELILLAIDSIIPSVWLAVPESLHTDIEFLKKCITKKAYILDFFSYELRNNKNLILEVVNISDIALKYASDILKDDKDVVLAAITKSGTAFQYASDKLKKDKDLVSTVVTKFGLGLQYANDNLKNDKDLVLLAVTQSGNALKYASDELKKDKDIV